MSDPTMETTEVVNKPVVEENQQVQSTDDGNTSTSTEPVITPIPTPPAENPLNFRIAGALEQLNRENVKLREKLESIEAARSNVPVVEDAKEFFDNPHKTVRTTVQEEIRRAIDPINNFIKEFKQTSNLDAVKQKFFNDPNLKPMLTKLSPVIDSMLQGQQVNEDTYRAAMFAAIGMYNTNQLAAYGFPYEGVPNMSNPTKPPVNTGDIRRPATMPPSPPSMPQATKAPPKRALTESERINLARFGLTEEEFLRAESGDLGTGDIDSLRAMFPNKETK